MTSLQYSAYAIASGPLTCYTYMTDTPLDVWYEDADPPQFAVPLDLPFADAKEIFTKPSFKAGTPATLVEEPLTPADRSWIVHKGMNPDSAMAPPSYAAQKALDRHLKQYDFVVPGSQDQWQSYIMYKYFELSLDPDPKISKPALDALAKTSIVGLAVERQEISISNVTNEELDKRLKEALGKYAGNFIEGKATRV